MSAPEVNPQSFSLPPKLNKAVQAAMKEWRARGNVRRLWAGEAGVWTGADESKWLGWLGIVGEQLRHVEDLRRFAAEVQHERFTHALLLGMGGSSLCPEVLRKTFGRLKGFPELLVLDSTDPAQIRSFENRIDLAKTLFVVSSKSGGTLEPNILKQYFFERAGVALGRGKAGKRFIAITDPGSKMQQIAEGEGFRRVFFGRPDIGGRYSALSNFGMAPAALMGLDVAKLLARTEPMVRACSSSVPLQRNPGVALGLILGAAARQGRDKVTFVLSKGLVPLGAWLEQLIAESTGKSGKGLIPLDREAVASPRRYGDDRILVHIRLETDSDAARERAVRALSKAGHPVVRITVADNYDLGQEFFRWEIATAVAGAVLGINPFDQPDVEASKVATRRLTDEYEARGSLPAETPFFKSGGLKLYADASNAATLGPKSAKWRSLEDVLRGHLNRLSAGNYFALLAYVEMNAENERALQAIRHAVRDAKRVATCLSFGPRFLHSTGQAYKGGPNTGVFLQVTCEDAAGLPVPGRRYTFGVVKSAQARGDFKVLAERGRRLLRVHLGKDVKSGLAVLGKAVREALA